MGDHGCGVSCGVPGAPSSPYDMLTIDKANEIVQRETIVNTAISVPIASALGHILAEDLTCPGPLPAFPASIKDGYAVVAADGAGEFEIVTDTRAGDGKPAPIKAGQVAYITTGAPVPAGADAVVQVENTVLVEDRGDGVRRVRIVKPASGVGQDIRPVGSDMGANELVLRAGEMIGAAEVGIMAAVAATHVKVYPKPKVCILSTGDELVDVKEAGTLEYGQIPDSNRPMLMSSVRSNGGEAVDLGMARDEEGGLEACLQAAIKSGAQMLLTSGGVSMGDRDLVKPLLEKHGKVHFGRVLMKPGKPLTFATIDTPAADGTQPHRLLVLALPGNPVSSLVCFNLVAVPALRKMAGWTNPMLRRLHVSLGQDLKLDPERPEYHRATLCWRDGQIIAESTGRQISSRLLSMRSANALLELPQASGVLKAGTVVSALLIGDLSLSEGMHAPLIHPASL